MADYTPVPFSFFVSLCHAISDITPKPYGRTYRGRESRTPEVVCILARWTAELRTRFPRPTPGTTLAIFRCLFPEEDVERRFDMQETKLASLLFKALGVSGAKGGRGAFMLNWWLEDSGFSSLGDCVRTLLSDTISDPTSEGRLSLTEIDELLNELAATSAFSSSSMQQYSRRRKPLCILKDIYTGMPPTQAAVITQIILKDLRPVLYPIKTTSGLQSLKNFDSKAVHNLTLIETFRVWDASGTLGKCYRVRATLEDAIDLFESETNDIRPRIGVPVEIPKCVKGQGCTHALQQIKPPTTIWAETKYDGERMQIHVEISPQNESNIKIFSKSKRDSTWDRFATHWIIREALGLCHTKKEIVKRKRDPRIRQGQFTSVILEAEMVAYEKGVGIDEFWRIRELIESSAFGVRGCRNGHTKRRKQDEDKRHLAIVFFDVLYLNGEPLISEGYSSRRAILESIVSEIREYAFIARRKEVIYRGQAKEEAVKDLQSIFSECTANHEEGLVLKVSDSSYCDWRKPWVKVKKDYIPGHGDSVDVAIIGAIWDKDRGRELRVPAQVYTTLYVGIFSDKPGSSTSKPHLEVYFTVSYGLSRDELEQLNFLIKSSSPIRPPDKEELPFSVTLHTDIKPPAVYLRKPLLSDLYGAGFTKYSDGKPYQLRFPRINKLYREADRSWMEGIHLDELERIALESIGKNVPQNDLDLWCEELWHGSLNGRKRKATDAFGSNEQLVQASGLGDVSTKNCTKSPFTKEERKQISEEDSQNTARRTLKRNLPGKPLVPIENIRSPSQYDSTEKRLEQHSVKSEDNSGDIMKFLADSWFWVPDPRPLTIGNDPKSQVIATNVMHSLDAFLSGCGWVVNMQIEEGERLQMVEKLRALERGHKDRIPILIFNLATFAKDLTQEGDVFRVCTVIS